MNDKSLSRTVEITVLFPDLDPMDVVWHGNYWRYFDAARSALLRSINYDYPEMRKSGWLWPVVNSSCRYYKPLKFGQRALVTARIKEYEALLRISYLVTDPETGERFAKGETTQVAVDARSRVTSMGSPAVLIEKVKAAEELK